MAPFKVMDLKTADECLSLISKVALEIKRIETERDEAIHKAKLKVKEDLLCLREQIEQYEIALGEFGEAHKELFIKPRTHELAFGTIGFKKTPCLKTLSKWTFKKVLVTLLKRKKRFGLRIRYSVNKRILETWSNEKLREIGLRKLEQDKFSYSLKEE